MAVTDYANQIASAADRYGVPAPIIAAIMQVESGGNPNETGAAGERGLMQILPSTGVKLGLTNPFDPQSNINAGAKLLGQLYNSTGNWQETIKRYNAGKNWQGSQAETYYNKVLSAYKGGDLPSGDASENPAATDKHWYDNIVGGDAWYERLWAWIVEKVKGASLKILLAILAAIVIVFGIWKLINS